MTRNGCWLMMVAAAAIVCLVRANCQQLPPVPAAASQAMEAPQLEFVFEEFATLGPGVRPGATPFGERNIVPITGGIFTGPRIKGKVLPGGWDWQLVLQNGCHSLHADYMIQADDGAIINVVNNAMICDGPDPPKRHITSPKFEAPLGPYAWLNSGAYVATIESATFAGKPAVHIRFYLVK